MIPDPDGPLPPQGGAMARTTGRRWRQLTVLLHVLSSVGWMTMALTLLALLALAASTERPDVAGAATSMAAYLDTVLLAPLANASALTGIVLALATGWGLARHWWVLAKFAITLVQLHLGIFVLSGALHETAAAGGAAPPTAMIVGSAAMASAIAFQGWLSVVKPWSRTPWVARGRPSGPPSAAGSRLFAAVVVATAVDVAAGLAVGHPLPVASLAVLVAAVGTVVARPRGAPVTVRLR